MPPVKDMLKVRQLVGFESIDKPLTPPVVEAGSGLNPYLRCPLPPFSTTIDTIRQWNMTGKIPVMRVIPLPVSQGVSGGNATNVTNVTEVSSGGGSTTTELPTLTPVTIIFNVPPLLPQDTYTTIVKMSLSFQLLAIRATQALEVRLYSNPSTQANDIARLTDIAVPFQLIDGVLTDVVFDTAPYIWTWQNRIGANDDTPQDVNIYVTVVNPSVVAGSPAATVIITFLPLET